MPVQVSYKKQFLLLIMLFIVLLAVVEIFVNVWWFYIYTCEFEKTDFFENLDEETRKQLCLENLELQHRAGEIKPFQGQFLSISSHGFRGPEISMEKPENTYRIFVVGGSTTFGTGVGNNETAPAYLQKKFDDARLDFNVEVINAGIPGMGSEAELQLIKSRLVNYNPDLFLVYDGINELDKKVEPTTWKERVIEICKTNKNLDIETVVILQPMVGTANRPLTDQESEIFEKGRFLKGMLERYPSYAEQLPELSSHCNKAVDLRGMFDNILDPSWFDLAHLKGKGNQIVAENMYRLSFPLVLEKSDWIEDSNLDSTQILGNELSTNKSSVSSEYTFEELERLFLSYKTPRALSYFLSSFNTQFVDRDILFENKQTTELDTILVSGNSIVANLIGKDFSGVDLKNEIFIGAYLRYSNFENSNLQGADFSGADMRGTNLKGANLQNANLAGTDLSWSNLSNVNLVNANLDHTKLVGANLTNATLVGAYLSHTDISVANLHGANLNGVDISNSDFSVSNLQDTILVGATIKETIMHVVNLMNADLTNVKMIKTDLYGANLEGAIMEGANLTDSNLTCIKHPICS